MYDKLYIAEKPSLGKAIVEGLVALSKRPGNEKGDSVVGVKGDRGDSHIIVGGKTVVSWFVGHMYEQANPEDYDPAFAGGFQKSARLLPVIPGTWKIKPVNRTIKQLKVVNELIKQSATIVNAGDPDDEGQLLVDEALNFINNKKPTLRLLLNALDPASVALALQNELPNDQFIPIFHAAMARQRADWLVGMNMTRACTVANTAGAMLTVGRVQTPTAALAVARRLAIENFVPEKYFMLMPEFKHKNGDYKGKWMPAPGQSGLDKNGRLVDAALAKRIVSDVTGKTGNITDYSVKAAADSQPMPFSLSTLQAKASAIFGMSPARVLEVAQSLYETHKVASYPRTDSGFLKQSQHAQAASVLAAITKFDPSIAVLVGGADKTIKSPAWNDKKVVAHHGIIPTASANYNSLTADERKIFSLIVKQYVAQFYPEYSYNQTTVLTQCSGHNFKSSGRTPVNMGWKKVFGKDEEELTSAKKKEGEEDQNLPDMKKGDAATCTKAASVAKATKAPPHYTEGTLLEGMSNIANTIEDPELRKKIKDCKGIGTPATQSAILEKLKKVGFLEVKGKHIIASDGCVEFIQYMPKELVDAVMTAMWQMAMDRIKAKELTLDEFMTGQVKWITDLTKKALATPISISLGKEQSDAKSRGSTTRSAGSATVMTSLMTCPKCGKGQMHSRIAKTGANAGSAFMACNQYPNCKHTENIAKSAPPQAANTTPSVKAANTGFRSSPPRPK